MEHQRGAFSHSSHWHNALFPLCLCQKNAMDMTSSAPRLGLWNLPWKILSFLRFHKPHIRMWHMVMSFCLFIWLFPQLFTNEIKSATVPKFCCGIPHHSNMHSLILIANGHVISRWSQLSSPAIQALHEMLMVSKPLFFNVFADGILFWIALQMKQFTFIGEILCHLNEGRFLCWFNCSSNLCLSAPTLQSPVLSRIHCHWSSPGWKSSASRSPINASSCCAHSWSSIV